MLFKPERGNTVARESDPSKATGESALASAGPAVDGCAPVLELPAEEREVPAAVSGDPIASCDPFWRAGPSGSNSVAGRQPSRAELSSIVVTVVSLLAADLAGFAAAHAALVPFGAAEGSLPLVLALSAVSALVLFWTASLYAGYRLHQCELLRRRAMAILKVAVVGCLSAGLLLAAWGPPVLVAAFLAIALALQLFLRSLVRAGLRRAGHWGEATAILVRGLEAEPVLDYFAKHWECGVRFVPGGVPGERLPRIALIAGPAPSEGELRRLRREYSEIVLLADLPGIHVSGLRPADLGGEIGLRLAAADHARSVEIATRALDIVVAVLLGLMAVPVFLLAAAAIYIVDPGPVIYRQLREGARGRPFRILKLRTMFRDAEKRLEALLQSDPAAQAEWSTHFKLRHDPRILPVFGDLLRKSSIDELPQLFNVIAGDMRIVGPRPFPTYHLAAMDPGFRAKRGSVVPGLTGLWQISDRSAADLDRQQLLDDFYIENRSFWLDIQILLQTVSAVLRGDGAY